MRVTRPDGNQSAWAPAALVCAPRWHRPPSPGRPANLLFLPRWDACTPRCAPTCCAASSMMWRRCVAKSRHSPLALSRIVKALAVGRARLRCFSYECIGSTRSRSGWQDLPAPFINLSLLSPLPLVAVAAAQAREDSASGYDPPAAPVLPLDPHPQLQGAQQGGQGATMGVILALSGCLSPPSIPPCLSV